MWDLLRGIQDQVTKYATLPGQIWYLCVFVFRLIVVVTIAEAVYGDELSEFSCSTQEPGCQLMCFNEYYKISHIRFWSFQILAIATPTLLFHLFSAGITGWIQKIDEELEGLQKKMDDTRSEYSSVPSNPQDESADEKKINKLKKQKKKMGNVKMKKVYTEKGMQQVAFTNIIHIAYFINVVLRLAAEGVFIYLAYQLFNVLDASAAGAQKEDLSNLNFILFNVPAMYRCTRTSDSVLTACSQALGHGGSVPCWVSRPWEKSILIRYMNFLSGICFLLCCVEIIYLIVKAVIAFGKQNTKKLMAAHSTNILRAAPIYGTSQHHYPMVQRPSTQQSYYLSVPVKGGYNNGYVREVATPEQQVYYR